MLIKTKLFPPQPPPTFVPRQRLLQKLDAGAQGRLTAVHAPAGFGKTALVVNWLATRDEPVAWLSLETADSDPTRFTRYLIAALRIIHPATCAAIDLNDDGSVFAVNNLLPVLVNDLAELARPSLLVLDDYHLIDNADIHKALDLLLEHMPPNLKLVLISRGIPPLSLLPRLRVRRQANELGTADLRFTNEEVAQFLQNMGLALTPEQVDQLEARTEGWVAGLQLAAVSMQGRDDIGSFMESLNGRHRYIVDYLAEEALQQCSADTQQFLLQTCVLTRLSADLCNAVTQRRDSQQVLEQLHRQNLFIVPLDQTRTWYRYHHFFDDFLAAQLESRAPERIPELNQRAADWLIAHDEPRAAIQHLLAAGNFEQAGQHIATRIRQMVAGGEATILDDWLAQLPADVMATSPLLLLGQALIRARQGDWQTAQANLAQTETAGDAFLTAVFYLVQSEIALRQENLPQAITHAQRSLAQSGTLPVRLHISQHLLTLYRLSGALSAMRQMYEETAVGNASLLSLGFDHLVDQGDSALLMGRLHAAAAAYRQGLQQAKLQNATWLPIIGALHIGLGRVLLLWGEWQTAETHLQQGLAMLGDKIRHIAKINGLLSLHFLLQQKGEMAAAADWLAQAEQLAYSVQIPTVNAIFQAFRAESALQRGDMAAAMRWVRQSRLPLPPAPIEQHTIEYRVMATILLAQGQLVEALRLLDALEAAARAADLRLLRVDALILRACVLAKQAQPAAALATMQTAVAAAEVEGMVRPFHNAAYGIAGETAVVTLLRQLRQTDLSGFLPDFVDELLTSLATETRPETAEPPATDVAPLLDPLTDRELDVLTHLVQGLSNQAIAEAMFVAVTTVRTHLRNLYSKLDAHSRTHAIARAIELNLVE